MEKEKLKTLKDLMKPAHCKNYSMLIKAKDLRAEAVKWVKQLEKTKFMLARVEFKEPDTFALREYMGCSHRFAIQEVEGQIKFIKHFFNLTEDDLR